MTGDALLYSSQFLSPRAYFRLRGSSVSNKRQRRTGTETGKGNFLEAGRTPRRQDRLGGKLSLTGRYDYSLRPPMISAQFPSRSPSCLVSRGITLCECPVSMRSASGYAGALANSFLQMLAWAKALTNLPTNELVQWQKFRVQEGLLIDIGKLPSSMDAEVRQ